MKINIKNRVTNLLGTEYPILQGGMVWCSGWRLAAAVSRAGGLGTIGSGSMRPDVLREHIRKYKGAVEKPFAVNVPLLHGHVDENIEVIIEEAVPIVITSAGNPALYTERLHERGIKVLHVVANRKFAKKAEAAGVDAVICEGVEAGGHNGREETATMVLVPLITDAVTVPVLAAGGIGTGKQMAAAFALGAEGVQIGTRFALSEESSAHQDFKLRCLETGEGGTKLLLKKLAPTRMVENQFARRIAEAEEGGASKEGLTALLGRGRSRLGIFEGNLDEGELEIGQVTASISSIMSAGEIIAEIVTEFRETLLRINQHAQDG